MATVGDTKIELSKILAQQRLYYGRSKQRTKSLQSHNVKVVCVDGSFCKERPVNASNIRDADHQQATGLQYLEVSVHDFNRIPEVFNHATRVNDIESFSVLCLKGVGKEIGTDAVLIGNAVERE